MRRHLDLTDEEKEKLDGSYKVAKKLEKLQNSKSGQTGGQSGSNTPTDEAGREGNNDSPGAFGGSRSLDSQGSSEKTSPDTSLVGSNGCPLSPYSSLSLTASMQLVDEILSDQRMEKMDKIERLEAILSAATASSPSASMTLSSSELSERVSSSCCACDCHTSGPSSTNIRYVRESATGKNLVDSACQTLSTGDIVITKVFFPDADTSATDICLSPSPKKTNPAQL